MATSITLNWLRKRLDVCLLAASIVFFLALPELDLWVAGQFYDAGFYWNDNVLVRLIYKIFAKIHLLFLLILIGLSIFYAKKKISYKKFASLYLLSCLLIGPGILVNIVLKDNSVGRPRPVHVTEFNGKMDYVPVFHYSGECRKNCSFVSGHASIGFYAMALFWVTRRRAWLISGISLGAAIGFTRIIQGGHFLSDVVFSGWVVYFTCLTLAKAFQPKLMNKSTNPLTSES